MTVVFSIDKLFEGNDFNINSTTDLRLLQSKRSELQKIRNELQKLAGIIASDDWIAGNFWQADSRNSVSFIFV